MVADSHLVSPQPSEFSTKERENESSLPVDDPTPLITEQVISRDHLLKMQENEEQSQITRTTDVNLNAELIG